MKQYEKTTILERLVAEFPANLNKVLDATKNSHTKYIAELILNSRAIADRSILDWDFKSLTQIGEEDFVNSGSVWHLRDILHGPIPTNWHSGMSKTFGDSVCRNLWYFESEGLILYVKTESGFRPAVKGDAAFDFVQRLLLDEMTVGLEIDKPPSWANELFVNALNLKAHSTIWNDNTNTKHELYASMKRAKSEAVWRETKWLMELNSENDYAFQMTHFFAKTELQNDIDPSDMPDELHTANIAFRAVKNGFGNASATFRNRLIQYLEITFKDLNSEAVQRIATVANPDKSTGRKRQSN